MNIVGRRMRSARRALHSCLTTVSFCRPRKNSNSITASLLAPAMLDRNDGIFESTYILYAAAAALTPAATRQGGPKFGREHLRHLSVGIATAGEERDDLLRGVTSVHEEGEKRQVLATDVAGQALHLSLVIFPNGAVVF